MTYAQAVPKAELLPPAKAAAPVHITEGPALESVTADLAIIRWTSNNPGGSDEHFRCRASATIPYRAHVISGISIIVVKNVAMLFHSLQLKDLRRMLLARNKRDLVAATEIPASSATSFTEPSFD